MRVFGIAMALTLAVAGAAATNALAADCGFMPGPGATQGLAFPTESGVLRRFNCTNGSVGQATARFENNRKQVTAQIISTAAGVPRVTVETVGFDVNNGQIFCRARVSGGPGSAVPAECPNSTFVNRWRSKIAVP